MPAERGRILISCLRTSALLLTGSMLGAWIPYWVVSWYVRSGGSSGGIQRTWLSRDSTSSEV